MSKIKNLRILFLLLPILIILSSCSGSSVDEEETDNASSDDVIANDEDVEETSSHVEEEADGNDESSNGSDDDDVDIEHSHNVGIDAEVPEAFPTEDLPIPEGATVTQSQDMAIDSNERITIMYGYNGDLDELVEMYRDHFKNGGFDEVNDTTEAQNEYGGTTALQISAKKDDNDYLVEISTASEVEVTLLYSEW